MKNTRGTIEERKQDFINKAKEKYGDQYNYDKVEYIDSRTKVIITCKDHGDFDRKPGMFLQGRICNKCKDRKHGYDLDSITEIFVKRGKERYGDQYDYSLVYDQYKDNSSKVEIICKDHGKFSATPNYHLSNNGTSGCKKCGHWPDYRFLEEKDTFDSFSKKVKEVSNGKYSVIEFNGVSKLCTFNCEKHGEFSMLGRTIRDGGWCPECFKEYQRQNNAYTDEQVISMIEEQFPDEFEFDRFSYVNKDTDVELFCKKHNKYFWNTPDKIINRCKVKKPCTFCEEERLAEIQEKKDEEAKLAEIRERRIQKNREKRREYREGVENRKKKRQEKVEKILLAGEKKCTSCGLVKHLEDFAINRNHPTGRVCQCKQCEKEYRQIPEVKNRRYELHRQKIENGDMQYINRRRIGKRIGEALFPSKKKRGLRGLGTDEELFGCSAEFLREYIEKQFTEEMNWDNHGQFGWHVDHIKPLSSFDLSDYKQTQEANYYTNLRPLWWEDNLGKGDRASSI